MYFMYADNELLYAPNLADDGYGVISPVITMELNKAGSLTFTLPTSNVMYDRIDKLKTIITVFEGEDLIFRGRVLHDEKNYMNYRAVYCEGELSFLLDSVVRPYDHQGSPVALFNDFINKHNDQVDEDKQFEIGTVSITDGNDYVHYSSYQYPKTWDEIETKLVNRHGGVISASNKIINYTDTADDYSDQVIEFGKNLLDITEYISADEVFTVLIPLGKILEEEVEEGEESSSEESPEPIELEDGEEQEEKRLTIAGVNDGKDYIEDLDAIAIFGRITRVEKWDNVTEASILLSKAEKFLAEGVKISSSITVKAVDLHLIDVDTNRIKLGQMVRILSTPHNIDTYLQCSKIVLNMVNADKSEYTLGIASLSLTDKLASITKEQTGVVEYAGEMINPDNAFADDVFTL